MRRRRQHAAALIEGYAGVLQTDAITERAQVFIAGTRRWGIARDRHHLANERRLTLVIDFVRRGLTGGRPPKRTDDDIEAANAMLANPDIDVTQSRTASAFLRRRATDTFPPREPRMLQALDNGHFIPM